jgi:hypothetical protein
MRAQFPFGLAYHSLVVTDPRWECQVAEMQMGASQTIQNVMMTISLGEPFNGFCYKLVAAIIPLR